MDRNILNQYLDLKKELDEARTRKQQVENQLKKIEQGETVVDTVRGGEGGIQTFKIEGVPIPEYKKKKMLLNARVDELHALEIKCESMTNDVLSYINAIEDSHVRRIMTYRYVDGLSWNDVAKKIGGNTEDSVRKIVERYLNKTNCPICPKKIL